MSERTPLQQLQADLDEVFVDEAAVTAWLDAPSLYLQGETPRQAIAAGRESDAIAALEALRSGIVI